MKHHERRQPVAVGSPTAVQAAPSVLPLDPATLAHLRQLDEAWARLLRGEQAPQVLSVVPRAALPPPDASFDIVYLGGGLGLLHALAMQQRGFRTLVVDRRAVGSTHREWNISRPELAVLVAAGLFSWEEVAPAIAREYERGFIRFHDPHGSPVEFDLPSVLDLALDATALLTLARQKLEAAGGVVWEGWAFEHGWLAEDGPAGAGVRLRGPAGAGRQVAARLLVNGMGALSPLTRALAGPGLPVDGVCPTVGTVASGFAPGEVAPRVGEILVTLEGARDGRQLIWEGFPGHAESFTTYLFYYDVTEGRGECPHSLTELFRDYFALLPRYKRPGPHFSHLRPVYGFIPARHHLDGPAHEQARTARALLSIGDAAARQNPLTFTGFGSFVRHLPHATTRLTECLHEGDLEATTLATLSAGQDNLRAMWVLARFLGPRAHPDAVNAILRDFTRALAEVGPDRAAAFFLDRATRSDYIEILARTARHRPQVLIEAFQVLGPRGIARWLEDIARSH